MTATKGGFQQWALLMLQQRHWLLTGTWGNTWTQQLSPIPGDHGKVTAQGYKYTYAPTDRNSCQVSFSPLSRVWHLLSTAKVVCGAPTAAGGCAGPSGPPGASCPPKHLCAAGTPLFCKVSTACDRELFKKLPSMFCTQIESGLFRQEVQQHDQKWSYWIRGSLILFPAFSWVWTNLSASLKTVLHLQGTRLQPALAVAPPGAHSVLRLPPGNPCEGSASLYWEPLRNNIIFTLPSFEADPFTTSFSTPNTQ